MLVIIIYYLDHLKHSYILYVFYIVFYIVAWTASKPLTVFAKNPWRSTGFYTPLAPLGWVSYLAISMIIATLASCDQVIFEVNLCVLFKYVCVCFVKLETEFREIRHSWQINEITCLNEKIFFRRTLFIVFCCCFFQYKLHKSTNTYNYHGNASTVGRSVCSDPDESFGNYDINHVVVVT